MVNLYNIIVVKTFLNITQFCGNKLVFRMSLCNYVSGSVLRVLESALYLKIQKSVTHILLKC
jgi:hypothetical protein